MRPVGVGWNCSDKGHHQDACPKPKKDLGNNSNSSNPLMSVDTKKTQAPPPYKPKGGTSGAANTATTTDIAGMWSASLMDLEVLEGLADFDNPDLLDNDNNLPELVSIHSDDDPFWSLDHDNLSELTYPDEQDFVVLDTGSCHEEVISDLHHQNDDDDHGPSAISLLVQDLSPENITISPYAVTFATYIQYESPEIYWDMYDSGASHHMLPLHQEFINFRQIPPRSLTAAN
ncbi:hypothetical protein APHAL10511_008127 [Amanita phalloides]|nr:hypothetical protein APHAL10511_008127 [Amanita phalloides]